MVSACSATGPFKNNVPTVSYKGINLDTMKSEEEVKMHFYKFSKYPIDIVIMLLQLFLFNGNTRHENEL